MAFLVVGALRDGAPTHHAARALCITYPLLVSAAISSVRAFAEQRASARTASLLATLATAILIVLSWFAAEPPGRSAAEDRTREIETGLELRARGAKHITVTPCAYEQFALIAAYGAPENVTVMPTQKPVDGAPCAPSITALW